MSEENINEFRTFNQNLIDKVRLIRNDTKLIFDLYSAQWDKKKYKLDSDGTISWQ